jgi:aldose 1-epimerase
MGAATWTGEQEGIATATLAVADLEATFATGAGMVCCSLRHRGDELLGQRRGLAAYAATGSTMGIPFLHPWANRLDGPRYEQGGYTAALHPAALRIEIALRATGDAPVPVSFGWHPYLQLAGERAALELTLPARTHLALDERGLLAGASAGEEPEHAPLGERTFDDHYEVGEDPVAFTARDDDRVVSVRFERGYPYAQVFAPPGQSFVCFEPMTATVSALTHPGACPLVEAYDATFAIEVGSTMGA